MPKTKKKVKSQETDGAYLLKIVLYVIIGAQWVHVSHGTSDFPLPVGLVVGMLFASHDHFQIDRKVEYAILLIATLVGFWTQAGIYITL